MRTATGESAAEMASKGWLRGRREVCTDHRHSQVGLRKSSILSERRTRLGYDGYDQRIKTSSSKITKHN